MATKTISLELDAYEKLRRAKRHDRESFSSVVRRAHFRSEPGTGKGILEGLEEMPAGSVPKDEVFAFWERVRREDGSGPRISPDAWQEGVDAP